MSVSGISTSSLYNAQSIESNAQKIQQEFQQLGKDLQAGNLSAAQSDFSTLQALVPQSTSASTAAASSQSSNPIAQAFSQLGKDLQSGNLSAAQQDFSTIQQDFESQAAQSQSQATTQGHHHHHGGGSDGISELLSQLGTALQSGDLSGAQQAYSSLTQQLQGASSTTSASSTADSSGVQGDTINLSITI
jgi:outer membrane protein assembly factor BamD (BamD/ComL family)